MKAFANLSNEDIEEIYKTISSNVKRIRKEKGLTQTDVALSMGFTTATFFTNAENFNNKHFNLEHIIRIANVLEVDICEFFK
ncbi:helix-turn-helix domain-containing protein [Aliarcobacter butzleri]|uniref:helix-turn-helix domain-containing protein n=1 Tax=Aliarcobacter butzleri TaxID=28197 RepID=UPI00215A49B7|nr:helix-turn-helix transcriptional regulator [Aliarcobacter butzleri]MCR8709599.1 helix-turn-helix transcriptional regulator [Aliarcobacter butzleri]MDN5097224.1 helix-turn-helix transcriptional regulator [Aliarcobacter butzleri]